MISRRQIGVYFGLLMLSNGLGDPTGLVSLPVLFLLKDHLHLGPAAVAVFEAITLIPHYCSFLFGVLRDRWRPFGLGDRGYLMLAAPVAVGCYAWLAAGPVSYGRLLAGMVAAMIAYQMLDVASQALLTRVAQREAMTGRLSALTEAVETAASVICMLAGGWMAARWSPGAPFLVAAAFTMAVFVQAFWRPASCFSADRGGNEKGTGRNVRPLAQLLRQRGWWITLTILLLYNFSPGWGTPFLYYLTDKVGLSSEAFGVCKAVQYGSMMVAPAVYGILCGRLPLRRLLWWAVTLNIFPGFLFLLIGGVLQGIAVSAVAGLLNGFASVALFDLLMRSCPKDLEGSSGMAGVSAFGLAGAAGDLLGAWLYPRGGFTLCLTLDAMATALILPLLLRLPSELISTRDGEPARFETVSAPPGRWCLETDHARGDYLQ